MSCIFCKIVNNELPSQKVYEDDKIIAFNDVHPEAPVHVLVIPKKHLASIREATEEDKELLGHIQLKIVEIAKQLKVYDEGFRIVVNTGDNGGQTVNHLHYHIFGKRFMKWPPG